MEKQRCEEPEKRREEKKKEERRKKIREEKKPEERRFSCAKRRKSRQHSVFPKMCDICGSAGSKSSLAKPAGAERSCTETLHI